MSNLPKNTILQIGSLISLYISVSALLTLIFSTINIAVPDAATYTYEWEGSQSSLRLSLALLVVFFPTYLVLTRHVNEARRHSEGNYITFTKWLIYISLLVGGIIMLIDLVVVIQTFLEGEVTTRFILKAISVLFVIGVVFYYYLKDARGYWQMRPRHSVMYGAISTAVVIGMVGASLYHLEMPGDVRERKIDNQQISDLQDMQWRIEDFYRSNETLPENIAMVYTPANVPTAPEGREAYSYEVTGDKTYEFCATFATASDRNQIETRPIVSPGPEKNYRWDYSAGRWCFEREIDDSYRQ